MAMMGTLMGTGMVLAVFIFVSAGIHIRYTAESMPVLVIGAILLFCNYMNEQDILVKRNLMTLLLGLTVFSVLIGVMTGIVGEQNWIFTSHPEFYFAVERMFCFWK